MIYIKLNNKFYILKENFLDIKLIYIISKYNKIIFILFYLVFNNYDYY